MKNKYYSLDRIKKVQAHYKMLLGGRNIGKSYATKHDVAQNCFDNNKQFIYLRRWDEDIRVKNAINYFNDLDVSKITTGQYNEVEILQSKIYFSYRENGKVTRRHHIGFVHSLNQAERYKSQIFPRVQYIIYEEFITDARYLPNEPEQLLEYVSTIFRERTGVVYMVGNTISKLCPYFKAWNLDKVLKMKTHDIALFENVTNVLTDKGDIELSVKIAVEMCGAESVLSKMAFGSSADMIVKNKWRSRTCPLLSQATRDECNLMYTLFVICKNLSFRMELLEYKGCIFWYVKPQTKTLENMQELRIVSDKTSMYPLHTSGFNPITEREARAFRLIKDKKIYYCSNSVGSDFEQVLRDFRIMVF